MIIMELAWWNFRVATCVPELPWWRCTQAKVLWQTAIQVIRITRRARNEVVRWKCWHRECGMVEIPEVSGQLEWIAVCLKLDRRWLGVLCRERFREHVGIMLTDMSCYSSTYSQFDIHWCDKSRTLGTKTQNENETRILGARHAMVFHTTKCDPHSHSHQYRPLCSHHVTRRHLFFAFSADHRSHHQRKLM